MSGVIRHFLYSIPGVAELNRILSGTYFHISLCQGSIFTKWLQSHLEHLPWLWGGGLASALLTRMLCCRTTSLSRLQCLPRHHTGSSDVPAPVRRRAKWFIWISVTSHFSIFASAFCGPSTKLIEPWPSFARTGIVTSFSLLWYF